MFSELQNPSNELSPSFVKIETISFLILQYLMSAEVERNQDGYCRQITSNGSSIKPDFITVVFMGLLSAGNGLYTAIEKVRTS